MELRAFDNGARAEQLLHLIVEEEADQVFVLRLVLERFAGSASRNQLIDAIGRFVEVDTAIARLAESGALERTESDVRVTQRGKSFVAAFERAHEHCVRRKQPETVVGTTDIPTVIGERLLLYQAETSLRRLCERELLEWGLSTPQMLLLGALYWDARPIGPRRLRNTLVLEAQSLTGLIDRLEKLGFAKRVGHPKDRRKIRVQITPEGRKKYEEASARTDETVEDYFKALTPRERQQLRAALSKLRGAGYSLLGLRDEVAHRPVSS